MPRTMPPLTLLILVGLGCGARAGLREPEADAGPPADVAPADAAVCVCRVCSGSCVNVAGCPQGLCARGRCFPRCPSDGGACPGATQCGTSLDCDVPVQVCR